MREEIVERAANCLKPNIKLLEGEADTWKKPIPKLYRNYLKTQRGYLKKKSVATWVGDIPSRRSLKRRYHQLSHPDMINIVHNVLVLKESWEDTIRMHRVSRATLQFLLRKVKKNPKYFKEVQAKEKKKEERVEKVIDAAQDILKQQTIIERAAQVECLVQQRHDIIVPVHQVRRMLRQNMGLKYKKIKKVAYQGNSERSMVLRQQFSMKLLELLESGKRVLNIDETWISGMRFISRKWREHGSTNSIAEKFVQPRVSLIVAMDTEGEVYASFTQVNTDAEVFRLYISNLARQLDADRPHWRNDTVILLDGAKYHTKPMLKRHLR